MYRASRHMEGCTGGIQMYGGVDMYGGIQIYRGIQMYRECTDA